MREKKKSVKEREPRKRNDGEWETKRQRQF